MIQFDEAHERLDRYIWHIAHKFNSSVANFPGMDAADFHQMGLIKLLELSRDSRYKSKTASEFDAIFKRSFFNKLLDLHQQNKTEMRAVVTIDLEAEASLWGYDAFAEELLKHYQQHLEYFLSESAAVLLEYLLNPTPAIYHLHNIQRMRREALRMQGFTVHMPPGKLTPLFVGQALGLTKNRTNKLLREIRDAWTNHFQKNNLRPSAAMSLSI